MRFKLAAAVVAGLAVLGASDAALAADPAAGRAKAAACAGCHGEHGRSAAPAVPDLAGQKEAYLARQLTLFNQGARGRQPADAGTIRQHPIMNYQAALLDAADIRALARWYAGLPCR